MSPKGNGSGPSIFERLRRGLRGQDHVERPAPPLGEALHPVTLAAVALLVVNDWVLKPRFGPSAVTGKLSDLAGLACAPVVLSAMIGLVLHAAARLGVRVDPSLTRRRLVVCLIATGAGFAAVKLSATAAGWFVAVLSVVRPAEVYLDRTDLLCLPMLLVALWIGRDELRRVPLGRPAAILRLSRPARAALADVAWAGGAIEPLAAALDAHDVAAANAALRREQMRA